MLAVKEEPEDREGLLYFLSKTIIKTKRIKNATKLSKNKSKRRSA